MKHEHDFSCDLKIVKHRVGDIVKSIMAHMCIKCNKKRASFGKEGCSATHCAGCKLDGMRDVKNKKCIACSKKTPNFAMEGRSATHCASCKAEGMQNVNSKKCEVCKKKQPSFSLEGKRATHCAGCKLDSMQDVNNKVCLVCQKTQPRFGTKGGRATHCAGCKLDSMHDVMNKWCEVCNKKHPNFGFETGRATRCADCKVDGMRDVMTKKCEVCNKKKANFGTEGGRAARCADCKVDGMQDVRSKKCEVCNKKRPAFGPKDGKATRCADCMSEDMQNLLSKRCLTEGCDVITHETYCANCDTSRKRVTRVKENRLANYLRENIGVPWTAWNKQLAGSRECGGSKRPDFVWMLPHLVVVLECDENQHDDRCLPGERQRMFDIFNTYGGIHTIYLRFNPDAFKVDGVTRRVSMERRYAELKKVLDRELAHTVEKVAALPLFRVTDLFYNVNDIGNIYERKVFVPNEAYENAVWDERPI